MNLIIAVILLWCALFLSQFLWTFFLSRGAWRKDKLCFADTLRPNASIERCKPIKVGIWGGAHFELAIRFSDGSVYRTDIGDNVQVRHNRWRYFYTERDVERALRRAVAAHEKAVLEKG